MIRRPPRSTLSSSSAASDVYKRQGINAEYGDINLVAMSGFPEGAHDDKAPANNGCGFTRPKEVAAEEEKKIYNAGMFSADTMYCHHLAEDGRHCVLHGIPSSEARHCCGVIYVKMGFSKKMVCEEQRRPKKEGKDAGHDKCHAGNCPFVAEGRECPYMPLNVSAP
eukprot:TRINITY_DN2568_c0_g1_i1.p1 TRINITY_DN2568_c0_g1~~TRINITY_DN2568_c0_g1_i1.p1  ORF type:complete len:166 (+),score=43.56 TRINITY_DN2568_c0_g1_i1:87-584(+)